MANANPLLTCGPIDPVLGYFYRLDARPLWRLQREPWFPNAIVSDRDESRFHGDIVDGDYESLTCPVNPAHETGRRPTQVVFDAPWSPEIIHDLVWVVASFETVCGRPVADRIAASGLRGFQIVDVTVVNLASNVTAEVVRRHNATSAAEFGMAQIWYAGAWCSQRERIEPPEANKCMFCGYSPLVCPGCGWRRIRCLNCDRTWYGGRTNDPQAQRGEGQVLCDDDPVLEPSELSDDGIVVDPHRWDGSDFCGRDLTGIVTERVCRFLCSIHASFVGVPVPVNMHGVDKALREKLEAARRPVPVPS